MLSSTWLTMLVIIGSVCIAVDSKPRPEKRAEKKKKFMKFFRKYGYISSFAADLDDKSLKKQIKKLQRFAALPITGELNDATLGQLEKDRCGIKDPDVAEGGRRRKRYVLQGTQWTKKHVTWYLHNAPAELSREKVRTQLHVSFNMWSAATTLTFEELSTATGADIEIKFASYSHGDPFGFDGPGKTLAHGFYPLNNEQGLAGDVHFDASETFSVGLPVDSTTKDLTWVAVHEIGHALGLEHSYDKEAIMFPWYQGFKPDFKLQLDDILGIQAMYGAPANTQPTTTTAPTTPQVTTPQTTVQPTTPDSREPCPARVDAIFTLDKYRQYVFLVIGDKMDLVLDGKIDRRDLAVAAYFPKINGMVDAAYMGEDGNTVFFVGRSYYVYDSLTFVSGPESISKLGLPSYVSNLLSAQMWVGNGLTYYYDEGMYWRRELDKATNTHNITGPYSLTYAWEGIPGDITASGTINGRTLFFKGDQFYDLEISTVKVFPNYPRHISELLDCKPLPKATGGLMSSLSSGIAGSLMAAPGAAAMKLEKEKPN